MAKRKIIWSQKAQIKLYSILDFYTERNGSKTFSVKLYKLFVTELALLDKHPNIGVQTDFEPVRGLIIKDFIFFYEVSTKNIIIHTVWDCRQNPNDMKIMDFS